MNPQIFKSIIEMIDTLHTEEGCREYLESVLWGDAPVCPHCGTVDENHYRTTSFGRFKGQYKCKHCKCKFNVRIGTMFEGTHIPLKKWFYAIYLFISNKKGISSAQLARDISVTQKTAWFMLSRIRENLRDDDANFNSDTQVDETYVGGKTKRNRGGQRRSTKQKTPVFGMVSEGKVRAQVIPNAKKKTLQSIIDEFAEEGIRIISDCWVGYNDVHKKYIHEKVDHSIEQYVNENGFHTNTIEGFWCILKRGIIGIYHLVSAKHLPKYCKEFVYRYNTRKLTDGERFVDCLRTPSRRYRYGEICMKAEYIDWLMERQFDAQCRRECEALGLRYI